MYGLEDEELKKMCAPNNLKTDAEEDHCKTINELKSCQNLLGEGQKKFTKYKKRNFCLRALFIAAFIGVVAICYVFRPLDLCFGKDGKPGKCLEIFQCPFFLTEIKEGKEPVICEYNKKKLKVCCFDEDKVPDIGSRHIIPAQENEVEPEEDYKIVFKEPLNGKLPKIQDSCKPLTNYTKSGRKSFQKCLEYQDKYVYPCQESLTPNGGMVRMDHCNSHNPESLIIDGDEAFFGEFPHMALLGYDTNTDVWQCDGFIVSENYILTAGHCTFSPHGGKVTKVRIGFLRKSEEIKEHLLYKVKKIHKFPGYNPLQHYHDIALIETDRP